MEKWFIYCVSLISRLHDHIDTDNKFTERREAAFYKSLKILTTLEDKEQLNFQEFQYNS